MQPPSAISTVPPEMSITPLIIVTTGAWIPACVCVWGVVTCMVGVQ